MGADLAKSIGSMCHGRSFWVKGSGREGPGRSLETQTRVARLDQGTRCRTSARSERLRIHGREGQSDSLG